MHEVCAIVGEKNWKDEKGIGPNTESSISLNILRIKLLLNSFPLENDFCNFLTKFDLILFHAVYIDQNNHLRHSNIIFYHFKISFKTSIEFFPPLKKQFLRFPSQI